MKKILIATDFSPASGNALLYGTQLAGELNAKVILFHAYSIPSPIPSINMGISNYGVMTEVQQQVEDEAKRILHEKVSDIETVCEVGDPKAAIISMAKEKTADLVIIGMKGAGKNLKKIFGSTATSLTSGINIPVLIVPEAATFQKPDIIAFATDNIEGDLEEDLNQVKEINDAFHPNVYVVHVIKNEDAEQLKFSEMSGPGIFSGVGFDFPVDENISHGLNAFILRKEVKMLVMMPHKQDWAEKLFKRSETKDMIFHTHIPLLILPNMCL